MLHKKVANGIGRKLVFMAECLARTLTKSQRKTAEIFCDKNSIARPRQFEAGNTNAFVVALFLNNPNESKEYFMRLEECRNSTRKRAANLPVLHCDSGGFRG
jgi:hypothetical protein